MFKKIKIVDSSGMMNGVIGEVLFNNFTGEIISTRKDFRKMVIRRIFGLWSN